MKLFWQHDRGLHSIRHYNVMADQCIYFYCASKKLKQSRDSELSLGYLFITTQNMSGALHIVTKKKVLLYSVKM